MAKNNWRFVVDIIFGLYYTFFLIYLYRLTPKQIYNLVYLWIGSRFAWGKDPASESIKQGEGQLYPGMSKITN
jgi:hypothetical protein